jgi:hypothetical protein
MLTQLLFGRERLSSYSVHERPLPAADRVDRAEALEFVRDGFQLQAFLLPPVWFAVRGIWLGVLAYGAVAAAIAGLAYGLGLPPVLPTIAMVAMHFVFGAEADEVQRTHLLSRGWTTVGHVTGTGALDCERRFFDHWLPSAPMTRAAAPPPETATAPSASPRAPSTGILGNLLAPLRRSPPR